jgi:general nucleoside transport system permease protein
MSQELPSTLKSPRRRFPFRIAVEPRLSDPPKWLSPVLSLGAVTLALLVGMIIISVAGGNPLKAYSHILKASFGDLGVFSDVMNTAIPLMMVGIACSLAFRMRLWNIGAEGQFYAGAFGASMVVLLPILPEEAPRWLFIIFMVFFGMAMGAIWGVIPGFLKARFGVNEIISTLMLNYVMEQWVGYIIFAVWSEAGFKMSRMFPKNAWLPRLLDYAKQIPELRGLTTHMGLVFAIVLAVVVWIILNKSQWGYEIRLIGDNPSAAKYAGISIGKNVVLVMALSGAIAGLAGMSEITGVVHRFQGEISPGYGFTGIIIAWLAKLNPFIVILVSILFAALIRSGREIQPTGVPSMIQGVIFVCLIASDFFMRYQIVIRRTSEE